MTERKHLKQLVRQRMARTGEPYTTARRHVLAKADTAGTPTAPGSPGPAARPAGLLPGYDHTGGGSHHLSALMHNLLRQAGVAAPHTGEPYTEAMLAGLAGGIGFMYFVFAYAGHHPTMTVVTQHHPEPFIPAALDRAGVGYEVVQTGSAGVAEKNLRRTVDAGRAALCSVHRGLLPWAGEAGMLAAADPYEVVVCGLEPDSGTVLVDDECVRPNPIPAADFLAAWSGHRKGRHRLLSVTGPPAAGHDLAAAVRDAVRTTVAHLTGPVLGNSFDGNFGFSGMGRLADQLADTTARKGWTRRYAAPGALFSALTRLNTCLELEYGGPGGTRPLYADFLDEAAPLVDARLAEAATLFRASGEVWSEIAAAALVPAVPKLARYGELVEERLALRVREGAAAADRIAAISAELARLGVDTSAEDPIGPALRSTLLAELSTRVRRCRELEQDAVELLAAAIS